MCRATFLAIVVVFMLKRPPSIVDSYRGCVVCFRSRKSLYRAQLNRLILQRNCFRNPSLVFSQIKSNAAEDYTQAFLYTKPYRAVPTPSDFSDIFTNSIATEMEDSADRGHLTPSTRFVDFQFATESPSKPSTTISPPKIEHNITTPIITQTPPKRQTIRLPFANNRKRKEKLQPQRGILDLLFPEQRVRSFKTFFDAFKQLLSHTF